MIRAIINLSLKHRGLVAAAALALSLAGAYSIQRISIDAIPDLSDVQVIVFTDYPGQAPQVVEDQVTYPLSSTLLSTPGAEVVRGFSFFGFSLIYVIFEDGTDLYWARSRVLEYLSAAEGRLPPGVRPQLGPDATGVGWVYIYTLSDPTGRHNLQELRSLQDWRLRYELASVNGVAEVASLGGFVKQYQVEVDPVKLSGYGLDIAQIKRRIAASNTDASGRLIELGETEYMIRGLGYFESTDDIASVVLRSDPGGNPITVGDVARVQIGPAQRRGLAEWNGEGETVAGIVVARFGANALEVIERVEARIEELRPTLPPGVEIRPAYNRANLIERAVSHVGQKLVEEMVVVAIVTALFLLHFRSSLVAVVTLPVGVLASIALMHLLGVSANIMSLGGIAIAIGVMVDASIVLVENLHKHLEREPELPHLEVVRRAANEVGPALFFSLLIITVSFLPVLALDGQAGRLFRPLALTKTFAMAFSALLAITLIPALLSWFVRGRMKNENENPISRFLIARYRPLLDRILQRRRLALAITASFLLLTLVPICGIPLPRGENEPRRYLLRGIGGEFMPPLNEGDFLYMPQSLPGISITKAREVLQRTDQIIMEFPEVSHVLGKIGRAETATDPAPLTMIESHIMLKDKSEWRPGMTIDQLQQELYEALRIPGFQASVTFPIRTRIDMLSTGMRTPIGLKISGDNLEEIGAVAKRIEELLRELPGTQTAAADQVSGGRYIEYDIDRRAAARYGLTVQDVQESIAVAVGGQTITQSVEGAARYPVSLRYPRAYRDDLTALENVWVTAPSGQQVPISQVAEVRFTTGPPVVKSENARKTAWIAVTLNDGFDIPGYVQEARAFLEDKIDSGALELPQRTYIRWSGQWEQLQSARERLLIVAALALGIVTLLLYLHFHNWTETILLLASLAFAVSGGVWLMYLMDFKRSVATDVGFIALAGLAAETGIVMLLYLDEALRRFRAEGRLQSPEDLRAAVIEGAVGRVRPKVMTAATTLFGLLPIMWADDSGSRIMQRLAAPMIGGLITSVLLTLFLLPVLYEILQRIRARRTGFYAPFHDEDAESEAAEEAKAPPEVRAQALPEDGDANGADGSPAKRRRGGKRNGEESA